MGKYYVGAKKYMFAINRTIDKSQHWDGELYPRTSNTYSRIKGWIGNISQII
jgi:hypothetical protein